jgi:ssDNA-binding Zn-finger/Zn-ribbon topoisomerase 1
LKLPVNAAAQAAASVRVNNYGGKCVKCGAYVEAQAGRIEKQNGRWATLHLDGKCPEAGTTSAPGDKRGMINDMLADVEDGWYAVPNWTGSNDLTFIMVGTNQGKFNPSLKGHRYVRNVVGGGNEFPVTVGWIKQAVEAIKVDPNGAMALFGQEEGRCGKCHRNLTSEWRKRGIGPECSKRGF